MLNNDYYEDVKNDILEMLKEEYQTEEALADYIYRDGSFCFIEFDSGFACDVLDEAEANDSVTGNSSGSYFFNREEAKEYFLQNDGQSILEDAKNEGLVTDEEIGNHFLNSDWECLDVICRFYICGQVVDEAIEEFEQYLNEEQTEMLKEIYLNNGGEWIC